MRLLIYVLYLVKILDPPVFRGTLISAICDYNVCYNTHTHLKKKKL